MANSMFEGLRFIIAGRFKTVTQGELAKAITENGGKLVTTLDLRDPPTHLCLSEQEFLKSTNTKLKEIVAYNITNATSPITILGEDWVLDCAADHKLLDESAYTHGNPNALKKIVPAAKSSSALSKQSRGSKRRRPSSEDNEIDEDEDGSRPTHITVPSKKQRKRSASMSPPPLAPKPVRGLAKGRIPVDPDCEIAASTQVYIDHSGIAYDVALNQTNISRNNNKFYYIQLLKDDTRPQYYVWTHWGRVGEAGQFHLDPFGTNLGAAVRQFEQKFRQKTKLAFEDRHVEPKSGAYTYIERSYENEDDDDTLSSRSDKTLSGSAGKSPTPVPTSKLDPSIQELVKLIFDVSIMEETMTALNYDANKLPLGKLSQNTLQKGNSILKEISNLLADVNLAKTKYGSSFDYALATLTSRYYTVIPHVFGRNIPPVINNVDRLKREAELIESLGSMEIATEIINSVEILRKHGGGMVNIIDHHFESLQLEEFSRIDPTSEEYRHLSGYLHSTHGSTHAFGLEICEIFRVKRVLEEERWLTAGWNSFERDNRWLLWHGSRVSNFAGILSQGLRIAPPEAPVNGYMFGKGIYLANMASKSANYCAFHESKGEGLLLLCEAQLGDPLYKCKYADYDAASNCSRAGSIATHGIGRSRPTKFVDAKTLAPELEGITMVSQDTSIENSSQLDLSLVYDEFIVYDVSQVKIRYLFRVRLKH